MFKIWILILALAFAPMGIAQQESAEGSDTEAAEGPVDPGPLDPKYMGVHGMLLTIAGSKLIASHLPLYSKPHDAQILYKVNANVPAVTYMVRDADLVTIKPESFNLQRLMRGESFSVKADVYLGHFERQGMVSHEQIEITFDELLYLRMLDDIPASGRLQTYDSVPLGGTQRILVHQINQAPSYDHLVLFYDNVGCITQFNTSSAVPSQGELIGKMTFCGSMKPLYYETADFAQ